MRVGITTEDTSMESPVAERFGTARFVLVVDSETLDMEAVPNPGASSGTHAGINTVILAISKKLDLLITGYLSPTAEKYLRENGITVLRGVKGSAAEALDAYKKTDAHGKDATPEQGIPPGRPRDSLGYTLRRTARQFGGTLPIMAGVVLLMGLFQAVVGRDMLRAFFSGGEFTNTVLGALAGSLFAGNPIHSYLIGGSLLTRGVSMAAVTGFMVSWVSVGLLQMPAEIDALGKRFALVRNALSFVACLGIAAATAATWRFLAG